MSTVVSVELDDTVNQTTHFTLASLHGSHLADTAVMLITLFQFRYLGDLVWQQHLEAISIPEGLHFHAGMAAMAEYGCL
jgi:hypothetical protein